MEIKKAIDYFPVASSVLIEYGNLGQLYRMWTTHTAAGQNLWSYASILVALLLFVCVLSSETR